MTMPVADAVDEFFVSRLPKKHAQNTIDAYRRDIDAVIRTASEVCQREEAKLTVDDLTPQALRRTFALLSHHSASTIARTWSTLNQLFTFLVAENVVAGNPMAAVEKPRIPTSRPKAIAGDDSIRRLLTTAAKKSPTSRDPWPERDFAVITTLLTCGLRLSELLSLTFMSIDGPPGERVVGVRGKGNKERTVPLEPEVEGILATYIETRQDRFGRRLTVSDALFVDTKGKPLQKGGLQYLVNRLYREAGIRAHVPSGALVHALRHTFATSLARNGASGTELQRLLGHESLATTQRYVDASARELRSAARSNDVYCTLTEIEAEGE